MYFESEPDPELARIDRMRRQWLRGLSNPRDPDYEECPECGDDEEYESCPVCGN